MYHLVNFHSIMLSASALLLFVAAQQFPERASVIYTGVPRSSSPAAIRMVTHAATAVLDKTQVQVDSLTYLKNLTTGVATVTVTIPVEGHNPDWNMTDHTTVSVLVDDKPVALTSATTMTPTNDPVKRSSGVRAEAYAKNYSFILGFIGRQAHAVKVRYRSTLGHAGLDGAQRVVAYDETGASTWNGPVDQLNFAVKYTPRLVFQVFATLPPQGWQVGSMGAFIKQKNVAPSPGSKLIFTYYPGGYENIGH